MDNQGFNKNHKQSEFHKYRIEYESNMRELKRRESHLASSSTNNDEFEKWCLKAELASLKDCISAIVTSKFRN